jgi:Flp pilus assembly protein TadD
MKLQTKILLLFIAASIAMIIMQCQNPSKADYLNINNPKATYVGMQACQGCHADIYKTYMQTGMGQSWGNADTQKSAANFDIKTAHVFDAKNNLHYKPYWVGDSLHIMEYRLQDGDTIHKRDETIQYIVGSGQHTNSHIFSSNGYLYQAPITYYTQSGKWDLAPGFEDVNTRFDRKIETECITCHNGYPDWVKGSLNKYNSVKLGIDCERCHGPGSLHVQGNLAGNIHDTSKSKDPRIVNPRRMTIDQQNNLCQRCHLQGVAVLNDDKSFFDFEPSTKLSDKWNVFMPEYKNKKNHMIMASHVERMKMSKCYQVSGAMSCITCHNPHISVKYTTQETYNTACKNCHTTKDNCTEKLATRQANGDNCNACHIKKNSAIDIPHVAVHDHYIRKYINEADDEVKDNFLGMLCYNNDAPNNITKARSFLEFHERYLPLKNLVDSAIALIDATEQEKKYQNKDLIRAYFLKEDFAKVASLATKYTADKIADHWNAYRIGEALMKLNENNKALAYLQKACALMPYHLDYQNKLGDCYVNLKQNAEAKKTFQYILQENPKNELANSNLGFIYLSEGDYVQAHRYIAKAVNLNPNNIQALINLSVCYYNTKQLHKIKPLLKEALGVDSSNQQVKEMLKSL